MISNGHVPQGTRGNGTFSADVKLHLHIDGKQILLGQLGPGFAILRDKQELAATQAEIETIVDDKVTRWPIRITSKLNGLTKRFEFEAM